MWREQNTFIRSNLKPSLILCKVLRGYNACCAVNDPIPPTKGVVALHYYHLSSPNPSTPYYHVQNLTAFLVEHEEKQLRSCPGPNVSCSPHLGGFKELPQKRITPFWMEIQPFMTHGSPTWEMGWEV